MRTKKIYSAEVSIQSADFTGVGSGGATPLVKILLGVRKGRRMEMVQTNCQTRTIKDRTVRAVWNEHFRIPVHRQRDVLLFRVLDQNPLGSSLIGVCVVPIRHIADIGKRENYALEIFDPGLRDDERYMGHEIGTLNVAVQVVEEELQLLEKEDLESKSSLSLREKTLALQSRFLGIGELANILFEERYSDDPDANWRQAKIMLTEQRAYAIWEETGCTDDLKNFQQAERDVERDHGIWDGL